MALLANVARRNSPLSIKVSCLGHIEIETGSKMSLSRADHPFTCIYYSM